MIIDIIITVCVVLFSVVLHEFAHGWTANRFGDPTARLAGRLTLNPIKHVDVFGMLIFPAIMRLLNLPALGWAKPVPVNFFNLRNPKRDMIWVSIAGPATNFFLAVIASQFLRLAAGGPALAVETLKTILVINLVLALFNLIPIPPLDGGRVAVGLLPDRWAYRYAMIEPFGFIIILLLLNFGWLNFMGNIVESLANLLVYRHV